MRDSLQHEVRNEESCHAVNPGYSGNARWCGPSRGAAAGALGTFRARIDHAPAEPTGTTVGFYQGGIDISRGPAI